LSEFMMRLDRCGRRTGSFFSGKMVTAMNDILYRRSMTLVFSL